MLIRKISSLNWSVKLYPFNCEVKMLKSIKAGKRIPEDINVVIEIPMNNQPIKYEFDKNSNMLMVDRFMASNMQYPCNYGFIPNTISNDGDPLDALVVAPAAIQPGVLINCRPVGILKMTDESGADAKIIAVPANELTNSYSNIVDVDDLPELLLKQIEHFFRHYKDLDVGKWVRIDGFDGLSEAKSEIVKSISGY